MWSVTYCDIYSGWTVNRAAWNKGSAGVVAATRGVQGALPFELLGFDTDNGSHQGSRISMDGEEMKKVGIVPASALSAAFERAFRPEFVGFEQVETPPAQGGGVLHGILEPGAALVLVQHDAEHPVELVFSPPSDSAPPAQSAGYPAADCSGRNGAPR